MVCVFGTFNCVPDIQSAIIQPGVAGHKRSPLNGIEDFQRLNGAKLKNMRTTPRLGTPEFERLLYRLADDIIDAGIFQKLRANLDACFDAYRREFNESQAFWSLSFHAYAEAVLYRLGRVYVRQHGALSLVAWLEAIRDNPQLLSTAPDPVQLSKDIESVDNTDPLVKKLICLRGNFVAHINWDHIASGGVKIKTDSFALTWDEIDLLISRATDVLNRYSMLFNQTLWSANMAGRDDYKGILKAVRAYLEQLDAEIESEIEKVRSAQFRPGK